jgi:hypothetical protein
VLQTESQPILATQEFSIAGHRLVPKIMGNRKPGRMGTSKMGQRDLRRLLIGGAMAVVRWAVRKGASEGSWLQRMLSRKHRMLVAVALANKMARTIWALITNSQEYREPALARQASEAGRQECEQVERKVRAKIQRSHEISPSGHPHHRKKPTERIV